MHAYLIITLAINMNEYFPLSTLLHVVLRFGQLRMKFGKLIKRVAPPSHLNQYVAYDVLKKARQVCAKL